MTIDSFIQQAHDNISNEEYWAEYDRRVREYEKQGMTRSDAQAIVDAEDMPKRIARRND